jgi:ribosomal protein S17
VTIVEARPVSKTKAFALQSVDEKARGSVELKESEGEA